jgi:hypothetical protein
MVIGLASKFKDDIFVGARFKNKLGQWVTVVSFKAYRDIQIKWEDEHGYIGTTSSVQLREGSFKNPYAPIVRGVGFLGVGEHKPSHNGKTTREYEAWTAMFTRCYCEEYLVEYPTYQLHKVAKIWHNFQNFAGWYKEKAQQVPEGEVWHLDKDILKGVDYSPEVCVLVPPRLNMLLVKNDIRRGSTLIGVSYEAKRDKYRARCHNGTRKSQHLGWKQTEQEAFILYKDFKENLVKQLAEEYKDKIDNRAYLALKAFEVNMTD